MNLIKSSLVEYGIKKDISFPSLHAMKIGEQLKTYDRTFHSSNFLAAYKMFTERIDQDEATTLPPGCFFDGKIITEPTKLTVNIYKTPRHVLFDVDLSSDEGSLSDSFDLEECKDSQEYDSAPVSEYG